MKLSKNKAFTIAELLVMISILTVLFAAFAPVFTVRYNNASSEEVWKFIQEDTQHDAYSDEVNKSLPAESFIGVTPTKANDISGIYAPYSKVIIRSSNALSSSKRQAQIDFRYGNGTGVLISSVFAGNGNMMLGGPYRRISTAQDNTAFGYGALTSLTTGAMNTAVGFNALSSIASVTANTAIGAYAGGSSTTPTGGTFIGSEAGRLAKAYYNTAIGTKALYNSTQARNTAVGHTALSELASGTGNTAFGYQALSKLSSGTGNTYVGPYIYPSGDADKSGLQTGSYNTAIGYNAGNLGLNTSYKTFIGSYSGSEEPISDGDWLLNDSNERVFIGGKPINNNGTVTIPDNKKLGGVAVLEVHNVDNSPSVVINGNLIVRGQYYMFGAPPEIDEGTWFKFLNLEYYVDQLKELLKPSTDVSAALMAFKITKPAGKSFYVMAGNDGSVDDTVKGKRGKWHKTHIGHTACSCAINQSAITSYDWFNKNSGGSAVTVDGTNFKYDINTPYRDLSLGQDIKVWRNVDVTDRHTTIVDDKIFLNGAHNLHDSTFNYASKNGVIYSCCPILVEPTGHGYTVSDIRLKNVEAPFTDGLEKIKKLNVYNYTFKSDPYKLAHVGVIAQDLKSIFPTAVQKTKDGFYKIRWDEMFYAAINAVKELNTKVENLIVRVQNDKARLKALKEENVQLIKKLDELESELSKLEK
ncbi:tail fiber domain-containing protein [bacterium]|nr:tail fiber domain-containing protein [bacterium]